MDEVRRGEVVWRGCQKIATRSKRWEEEEKEKEKEKEGKVSQLKGIKDRVSDNDDACDSNVLSCITIGCRTALLCSVECRLQCAVQLLVLLLSMPCRASTFPPCPVSVCLLCNPQNLEKCRVVICGSLSYSFSCYIYILSPSAMCRMAALIAFFGHFSTERLGPWGGCGLWSLVFECYTLHCRCS
jgi:hypothetical protein